jgi:prepilin-type processing-associated H-X9-DG protein
MTNVVYADGHVKLVQTKSLLPEGLVMENGKYRGTAKGDATVAGNYPWTRD